MEDNARELIGNRSLGEKIKSAIWMNSNFFQCEKVTPKIEAEFFYQKIIKKIIFSRALIIFTFFLSFYLSFPLL